MLKLSKGFCLHFRQSVRLLSRMADVWKVNVPLAASDPELHDIIVEEKLRQKAGLEMIASENFTSLPVLECMGSCLHNKYSEGQ